MTVDATLNLPEPYVRSDYDRFGEFMGTAGQIITVLNRVLMLRQS